MSDIHVPDEATGEHQTIQEGYFEEELSIDAESASAFLRELAQQLEDGNEITLQGDGWTLPFTFREPLELDIELQGSSTPELEIELELTAHQQDPAPSVG